MTATTSRRAVLAGVAAAPALSLPAIAKSDPDAELLALGREIDAVNAQLQEAGDRCTEASDRIEAMRPQMPEPQPPAEYAELWDTITHSQMERLPDAHPLKAWDKETLGQRLAIAKARHAVYERLSKESGYDEAQARFDELNGELWDIGQEIWTMAAKTPTGILLKFRVAELLTMCEDFDESTAKVFDSIKRDLRAMAVQS